jgi:hypothetical protein
MISPNKVLLIGASDVPLSQQCGDWYASVRGIQHALYYPLADLAFESGVPHTLVRAAVANYVRDNAIQCVIALPGTPHYVSHAGFSQQSAFSAYYGSLRYQMRHGTTFTFDPSNPTYAGTYRSSANSSEYVLYDATYRPNFGVGHAACGRLGCPQISGGPTDTFAFVQRIVNDALESEQSPATAPTTFVGMYDRVAPYITANQFEQARRDLVAAGAPVATCLRSYNNPVPYSAPANDIDWAALQAGTLPPREYWGVVDSTMVNLPLDSVCFDSLKPAKGGWGFFATSSGMIHGARLLADGGCSYVGSIIEPGAERIPIVDAFVRQLLAGATMAEAVALSGTWLGWVVDVWGDPLYRPFGAAAQQPPNMTIITRY